LETHYAILRNLFKLHVIGASAFQSVELVPKLTPRKAGLLKRFVIFPSSLNLLVILLALEQQSKNTAH
jgi:hypothetical protein